MGLEGSRAPKSVVLLWTVSVFCLTGVALAADNKQVRTTQRSVLIATIEAECDQCAWDMAGREAVLLRLSLNGRYVQHLPVVRSTRAEYTALVGTVPAGSHSVNVAIDGVRSRLV